MRGKRETRPFCDFALRGKIAIYEGQVLTLIQTFYMGQNFNMRQKLLYGVSKGVSGYKGIKKGQY